MAQKEILGNFFGRTLVQSTSKLGGSRNVFVKLQGLKNELVFPTFGGQVKNPFKGAAKIFAGDLIEYRTNSKGVEPEIYILKSYEVVSVSGTTLNIVRDGYHHIPFAGDRIGLVDAEDGTAAGAVVSAVAKTKAGDKDVWALTLSATITGVKAGDILTEITSDNKPVVGTINAVASCDYDFCFAPAADPTSETDDFENARYFMTPALGGIMYKHKMSPIPAYVEKFNESRINGWFEIHGVHV